MVTERHHGGLFSALLRYWRGQRGMSQLDLGLAAGVSARHVSFLETGRAKPSREMVLTLGATLDVPLRDQNELLMAGGFEATFAEPPLDADLDPAVQQAIERMLVKQEPYPMVVMNEVYDVLRFNAAAERILPLFIADVSLFVPPINAFKLLFDPALARPFVADWERSARSLLSQLHREALHHRGRGELAELVESLFAYPGVPRSWQKPDFSRPASATFTLRLQRDGLRLAFLTTLTKFTAPRNITLEELRLESYFPLDELTEETCRRLAGD